MRRWVGIFCAALIAQSLIGQKPGAVSGRMIDASNNEPLSFGTVTVVGTSKGTVSDVDGYFRLENLQPGTVSPGFQLYRIS